MFEVMTSKGLGDALYMRALALHVSARREPVTVFTNWPEAFYDLPVTVRSLRERTGEEDIRHCSYCLHCRLPEVDPAGLFEMACRQAGVLEPVELRMGWWVRNHALIGRILEAAAGRKILVYQPPKISRGPEQALLRPRREAFIAYLNSKADLFRVRVGHAESVEDVGPFELDLRGKTSIYDVFDVGAVADTFFGEPSYLLIMAQATEKPFSCLFSRRAAEAKQARVRNLTPARFFHRADLATAVYDD